MSPFARAASNTPNWPNTLVLFVTNKIDSGNAAKLLINHFSHITSSFLGSEVISMEAGPPMLFDLFEPCAAARTSWILPLFLIRRAILLSNLLRSRSSTWLRRTSLTKFLLSS
jgi:hypothetical protein